MNNIQARIMAVASTQWYNKTTEDCTYLCTTRIKDYDVQSEMCHAVIFVLCI